MANESIKKFFEASLTDQTLAKKLSVLAAQEGYKKAAEEFGALGETSELSDDESAEVSGGGTVRRTKGPNLGLYRV